MSIQLDSNQLEAVARLFRVLAEPTRLAILQLLKRGRHSVGELVKALHVKQANVSKQLGLMYEAGLLDRRRERNQVFYSVREPVIFDLCEIVCAKLQRDGELDP